MSMRLDTAAIAILFAACSPAPEPAPESGACTTIRAGDLPAPIDEASGIAMSARDPGVLWVHNDSERSPTLYAIDRAGGLLAEIALPGAVTQINWEDIAIGPCPAGRCIYIGDIGDNLHERDDRAILRIAEPDVDAPDPQIDVERFPIRYPDGPEDAEALFMTPDTVMYIVTKGRRRPVTLYRYPPPLRADETVTLERMQQFGDGIAQLPDMVSGASASYDGGLVAIRTYTRVELFRFDGDTLVPHDAPSAIDLAGLAEPQGEGVGFAGGDTLLLVTESGPADAQPFLSRIECVAW